MKKNKTTKNTEIIITQPEVVDDRKKLREYCRQNNITTPDFFASNQFAPISLWAMKKNAFPLCIKTSKNLSNNQLIYILKAFRELPEFFETIQAKSNNGEIIIEEFLDGKARLEVTYFQKQIRLISQVSFTQSMKLFTKWIGFPIKLPESIFVKIKEIISHFSEITAASEQPVRFSFVVKNMTPILTSINIDDSRLEYNSEWRKQAELEPLSEASYPPKTSFVSKINIYKGIKNAELDFSPISGMCEKSKSKWEIKGTKLYVMLTSNDPKKLTEDFAKVDAIVKQIISSSNDGLS